MPAPQMPDPINQGEIVVNPQSTTLEEVIRGRIDDPSEVPRLYANGFTAFRTNADTGLVLTLANRPVAVINMSFTLAKTMAEHLGTLVADLEVATKRPILTTGLIEAALTGTPEDTKDDVPNDSTK